MKHRFIHNGSSVSADINKGMNYSNTFLFFKTQHGHVKSWDIFATTEVLSIRREEHSCCHFLF